MSILGWRKFGLVGLVEAALYYLLYKGIVIDHTERLALIIIMGLLLVVYMWINKGIHELFYDETDTDGEATIRDAKDITGIFASKDIISTEKTGT